MKRLFFLILGLSLLFSFSYSFAEAANSKIILLISEQNIEGPQRAWWASEVDLSTSEAAIAKRLIQAGYEVLEPSNLNKTISLDKAFRLLNISDDKAIKLGNLSKANYVIVGKAIASSGSRVPQSNMISCFANITAKMIRVKDGKVLAYLDASGNSAHMDVITGGREALSNAAEDLTNKLIQTLNSVNSEGGK